MSLERIKTENDLNYGYGKVLPRIEEKPEDNPKVFMNEFASMVQEVGASLARLSTKLVKAKELFPGNQLVKKVDEVLGKMAREPSILSQDEKIFGSENFLNAIAQIEKELMEASEAEKKKIGNEKEYDIRKAFSLGCNLTPPTPTTEAQINVAATTSTTTDANVSSKPEEGKALISMYNYEKYNVHL
ncbi:uncharacterized protein LOC110725460 [Chenopodium quinoa]|uniref:uncharacterized protein LOC110725460 n=1 Tax=Chenopodium quinoa TaxID=63459 RepID=UPI000B771ECD|nr:uncharacterized protein LOC110725460 [Chenopodium quinoa]